jgi:putative ABC transport system permease protein
MALATLTELAWRDYLHEWRISVCLVLSLMSVLTPLLVLFGLKFGVIETLTQRLEERPEVRQILPVGHTHFTADWLEQLANHPDTGFLIPATRRIAASVNLLENPLNTQQRSGVQMLPSAVGDPLLSDTVTAPTGMTEVTLSQTLARRLGAAPGDELLAVIGRRRSGQQEHVKVALTVVGVLRPEAMDEEAALVSLAFLSATEDYRDGFGVSELDWDGASAPRPRVYPRFRLYARSIYTVDALADWLEEQGIEVMTRSDEIATIQGLRTNLEHVFWLLAGLAAVGYVMSLAAMLAASVERKHQDLSVMRLIGFEAAVLPFFPVVQSVLTVCFGILLAVGAYLPIAGVLNHWFADSLFHDEQVCRLLPSHVAMAGLITLCCGIIAAAWAGRRAASLEPSEGLKDV